MNDFLEPLGITSSFVEASDPGAWKEAIRPETRLLYIETPANPTLEITDLSAITQLARSHGLMTVADNTFATPFNQRPLEHGVDVVVHSATKYLGGHGDLVAGAIIGSDELITRARWKTTKLLGGVIAPDVAWLVLRGLRTLPVRMQRHNETALTVAAYLSNHTSVSKVHYPGLKSCPGHALAASQMSGFGGIVSFDVRDAETAKVLINGLQLCSLAVSLGDTRTLIQHSASMTHASTPAVERERAGLKDGLLRLSVGLERASDIIADLDQGLARIS
jgi:methionine-gamma-lyase